MGRRPILHTATSDAEDDLEKATKLAEGTLESHRKTLDRIAALLLKQEEITGEVVMAILS